MSGSLIKIDHFTDPVCPWAFSAEPDLLALRWLYGDQLEWTTRLVVLTERPGESAAKGMTLEKLLAGDRMMARRYEMPIKCELRPRLLVARPVDLIVKAAQLNDPENAEAVLRALRVAWHSDHVPIDDPALALDVAATAGADREALERWAAAPATDDVLAEDMRAARTPLPAALGPLDHELGGPPEQRRYTCPSLVFTVDGDPSRVLAAPGFQSLGTYEVLLANLAPELVRAEPATDPLAVLDFADWPLAAVEVARVMGVERGEAEEALRAAGAAQDARGYWTAPQ